MEGGDPSVTIDLLLRALILLGVSRGEIASVLVFEEPKSLSLGPLQVASTETVNRPFFWYQFPGKSHHGRSPLKPQESREVFMTLNDLVKKDEVAYG